MQGRTDGDHRLKGGGDTRRAADGSGDPSCAEVRRQADASPEWKQRGRTDGAARGTTARLADTMADAGMVRARLLRAVDRQARLVDRRLTGGEATIDERDARILGHLAKTLGTLMEIGEGGRTSKDREPPDRDDAEDRLAERIRRWARGGA